MNVPVSRNDIPTHDSDERKLEWHSDIRYYRRHLPHWQPEGATYHIVFRLYGSLPEKVVEDLRDEREQMEKELAKSQPLDQRNELLRDVHWKIFERYEISLDENS